MRADRGQRRTDRTTPAQSVPTLPERHPHKQPSKRNHNPATHPDHLTLTPSTKNPTPPRHTPAWQKTREQERTPRQQPDLRARHSLSDGPESPHPYVDTSTTPKTPQRGSHVLPEGTQHPSTPVADRSALHPRVAPCPVASTPKQPLTSQQPSTSNSPPPATLALHPRRPQEPDPTSPGTQLSTSHAHGPKDGDNNTKP